MLCREGCIRLRFYRDNILHFAYFPGSAPAPLPMWGISAGPEANLKVSVSETPGWVTAETPDLAVTLERDSGQLAVRNRAGTILLESTAYGLEPARVSGEETYHIHASFKAMENECYYGLGQHQLGWMDQRGREVLLWHDYESEGGEITAVPFLVTNRGYGLIFDNPSRLKVLPGGADGLTRWQAEVGDALSFFIIQGATSDGIYEGYRFLTGPTPLPPKKGLGYIQCKQRYASQAELLEVGRKYRQKGYPCDLLVVDWFHWKVLGDLDLDPESWPDPAAMNAELAGMGMEVMISCWPRFMKESRHYSFLEERGWFMKDESGRTLYGTPQDQRGALIDTTNPDCARWYWETIQAGYGKRGFSSWWTDENEPDICPHRFYLHAGTGARIHNIYPLLHSRAIYEGHRRDRADRCLILSRSAYLGAQQYGATFWSSDIYPTWDVFRRQVPAGLNFCASGLAYWSADIGGWQALPDRKPADESYKALLIETKGAGNVIGAHRDYPELYVRWFQYGAFSPTFRAHGTRSENEVWSFGPEAEQILVKYLKLRYRLLPYIYSLAFRTSQNGAPFMRALFMDFPDDPRVRDIKDQYMFGPAFLVAPVTAQGLTEREVYLPAGTDWYDYWTNRRYEGGATVNAAAPLDTLPLFVRAGAIIPHGEPIEHTGQRQARIELHVYAGSDSTFDLYDDDGVTYNYEKGDYTLVHIAWDDGRKAISLRGDRKGLFARPETEWLKRIDG